MSLPDGISRRAMWTKIGVLFNGAVGVILAAPIVRYLFSPVLREHGPDSGAWLSLGPLAQFPEGETRLATFRHPGARKLGRSCSVSRSRSCRQSPSSSRCHGRSLRSL